MADMNQAFCGGHRSGGHRSFCHCSSLLSVTDACCAGSDGDGDGEHGISAGVLSRQRRPSLLSPQAGTKLTLRLHSNRHFTRPGSTSLSPSPSHGPPLRSSISTTSNRTSRNWWLSLFDPLSSCNPSALSFSSVSYQPRTPPYPPLSPPRVRLPAFPIHFALRTLARCSDHPNQWTQTASSTPRVWRLSHLPHPRATNSLAAAQRRHPMISQTGNSSPAASAACP